MKFLVDELPKDKNDCYYAKWISYPPIMEKSGDYTCGVNNKKCSLTYDSTECEGMKTLENFIVNKMGSLEIKE